MIFSRDIGIDLGTANTVICDKKGRIIIREPSVVAVDVKTKRVLATCLLYTSDAADEL